MFMFIFNLSSLALSICWGSRPKSNIEPESKLNNVAPKIPLQNCDIKTL